MRSYASVAAVRKDLAPGGPSTGPGAVGYTSTFQADFCNYGRTQEISTGPGTMGHTSTFQEDFCNHGRTQERSTRPGAVGYTVQEDPCYYRTFAPGQQVIIYYPSPPPGISPKFHIFWKPFTVVEMVGRVTVKVSQHNKKAIMVHVDRVLQESSTGTGYGAVGYTFQEDPCNYGDPRSRSENQHREMAYQGRNLYGIKEFKWGRSKNRSKNRHQGDIVVDNSKTRPAECPSGKAERAVWSAFEEDFEEFKWGRSKNRSKDKCQEDTVVDRDWVYQGKNPRQEDTVFDNNETRPAECPPGKVERAIWSVPDDDWARDA
jgi:hypothetical protein